VVRSKVFLVWPLEKSSNTGKGEVMKNQDKELFKKHEESVITAGYLQNLRA
jgi:hypothetical protein